MNVIKQTGAFFVFVQAELTTCSVGHAEVPLAGPWCPNRPENHFGAVFPEVKVALVCLMLCLIPLRRYRQPF